MLDGLPSQEKTILFSAVSIEKRIINNANSSLCWFLDAGDVNYPPSIPPMKEMNKIFNALDKLGYEVKTCYSYENPKDYTKKEKCWTFQNRVQ